MAGTRQPANRHLDKNPKGGEPEAGGKVQGERPLPRADIHRPMAHQPQDGRREHAPKVRRSGEVIRPPFRMMANGVIKTPLAGKQNYNRCPSARDANLFWRRHTPNLSQNRCDCQRRWRYYDPRLSGHDSSPIRFVKSGVNDHLRQGARGSAGSRQILGSALVSGSIALSLRLLVCAGLLLKSLSKLQHVDPGFQASGVLTLDFGMGQQKFHDWPIRTRFVERVIEGVRALPGVRSAGLAGGVPFTARGGLREQITPQGSSVWSEVPDTAVYRVVVPGYLETLQVPLERGRMFDSRDRRRTSRRAGKSQGGQRTLAQPGPHWQTSQARRGEQ